LNKIKLGVEVLICEEMPIGYDNKPNLNSKQFEQVFPKYITTSSEIVNGEVISDLKGIDTSHLVPLLIKAVQEQQQQINELCQKLISSGLI